MRKLKMNRWIATLGLCAAVLGSLTMMGCSNGAQDMVASGRVDLQKAHTEGVRVMWAEVRQDGQGAVVTGRVTPTGVVSRRYAGHVDVAFVDADGKVIEQACSPTIYVLNRGPGKGPEGKGFRVSVKAAPPAGSTVRVTYHRSAGKCQG